MGGDNLKEETVQAAVTHLKPLPEPPKELEKLFREHHDLIFRTAYRVTRSEEGACDRPHFAEAHASATGPAHCDGDGIQDR